MSCKVELFLSWLSVLELPHQKSCEICICKRYCPYGFFQLGGMLHNVVIFMTKCPQPTAVPPLYFKLKTCTSNNIQKERMHERSYKSLLVCWRPTIMSGSRFLDLEWMHGETATTFAVMQRGRCWTAQSQNPTVLCWRKMGIYTKAPYEL